MLQRPSSLKQMNFKMECFSSLLVTINTEVIELKFTLKLTNLCRLDEWHLSATIHVYISLAFDFWHVCFGIRYIAFVFWHLLFGIHCLF